MRIAAIMLIKKNSKRLLNKNWRCYRGKPMFQWNLEKCLMLFNEVYVSSDDDRILDMAEALGAIGIRRPPELLEATNIECYQHVAKTMKCDAFVAVQANSPDLRTTLIQYTKDLLNLGHEEVKTCNYDRTDYGSIWAMTIDKLKTYPDPYNACPSIWIKDPSVDIHCIEDIHRQYIKNKQRRYV